MNLKGQALNPCIPLKKNLFYPEKTCLDDATHFEQYPPLTRLSMMFSFMECVRITLKTSWILSMSGRQWQFIIKGLVEGVVFLVVWSRGGGGKEATQTTTKPRYRVLTVHGNGFLARFGVSNGMPHFPCDADTITPLMDKFFQTFTQFGYNSDFSLSSCTVGQDEVCFFEHFNFVLERINSGNF